MRTGTVTLLAIAASLGAVVVTACSMGLFSVDAQLMLAWWLASVTVAGIVVALLLRLRDKRGPSFSDIGETQPHRGINTAHVPVAGLPGLVLVVGFVWMFWFGVPFYRPLLVVLALAGCLGGAVLILINKRRRARTDTPLGLADPVRSDELKK